MFDVFVLGVAILASSAQESPTREPVPVSGADASPADVSAIVASWLQEEALVDRERRCAQLVALGAAAVPALQKLVDERSPAMGVALAALCRIGEPARPALPSIVAIAGDREFVEPEGQPAHVTARGLLFDSLDDAAWAAEQLVPVLAKVANDAKETDWFRTRAGFLMGSMGSAATPVLCAWIADASAELRIREIALTALGESGVDASDVVRAVAENAADPAQDRARHVLARMEERAGRQAHADYWAALIRKTPFDPKVRGWLMSAKGVRHAGQLHPLTQEIKQLWRARLAETPDAELAWQTALLVQDQLARSELDASGSHQFMGREDPAESYATLEALLRLAADHADRYTPRWQRSLRALAKCALLRGDWEAMNAALVELGERPIAAEARPWLAPPPKVWSDLAAQWQSCDEDMRNGDCAFEVRVEKDGRGVRGVHVVVRTKRDDRIRRTGVDVSTLLHDPEPMAEDGAGPHGQGFGFAGKDRTSTRYAVTDDSGVARFEQLPAIEIEAEVMIPTASFAEPIARYDLWRRQPDGSLELNGRHWREGFALASGTTTQGPDLVVRPHFTSNLADGQAIASDFELAWEPLSGDVRYEVELTKSFPPGSLLQPSADMMSRLATATVETRGHSWPLAARGVGSIALAPGNVYLVQVIAREAAGGLLARFGRTWCYVPWRHRESPAPVVFDVVSAAASTKQLVPLEAELWHHGTAARLDGFLQSKPDAFELEYARVGREWLRWRDGSEADAATARAALDELARVLPAGNVAGDTARELVRRIDAHDDPGKQLDFGATSR